VFSYGTYPLGMQRTYAGVSDPFARCQFGDSSVERGELVLADEDGVVFVREEDAESVLKTAEELRIAERTQVEKIRGGTSLRELLQFDRYLQDKKNEPTLTLGEHMNKLGRHF
jgi:4-hydroxy-4-methyl-2-oxoglutarate aldolase